MDIQTFQEKLAQLCAYAAKQDQKITGEQVRDFFDGLTLDREQLLQIFMYLKTQGIYVEGITLQEEAEPADDHGDPDPMQEAAAAKEEKENPCLTDADREYLKKYKNDLKEHEAGTDTQLNRYMVLAADLAAEYYRDGCILADLIQEANVALLTILSETDRDEEILSRLREGVKVAVSEQDERNFSDDCLVAKVQNLDSIMKELTEEDGGEPKFSVEELAIMLDMDIDEMKDIIRLTGSM